MAIIPQFREYDGSLGAAQGDLIKDRGMHDLIIMLDVIAKVLRRKKTDY